MDKPIYMGINISGAKRPYTYAVVDAELKLLALDNGSLQEVLAYAAGDRMAVVGVNAPSSPNQRLMGRLEYREKFSPMPPEGRWMNLRLGEYELQIMGAKIFKTPSSPGACPEWMRTGFDLYAELTKLSYKPYPAQNDEKQWLEAPAEVCFWSILGQPLLQGSLIEGRIQRQLILYDRGMQVPDIMLAFEEITRFRLKHGNFPFGNLYSISRLNALVTAYTAWLGDQYPEKVKRVGEKLEGQITIPAKD